MIKLFIYPEIGRNIDIYLPIVKIYIKYRKIHYIVAPPAPRAVLELTNIGTPSPDGGRLSDYSTSISNDCVVRGSHSQIPFIIENRIFLSCLGGRVVFALGAITVMRVGSESIDASL